MASQQTGLSPHETFGQDWLAHRAPYDEAARNHELEHLAGDWLREQQEPVVIDLGCGSGNNIQHLHRHWPFVEKWIGVDHDPDLLEAASDRAGQIRASFQAIQADLTRPETLPTIPGALVVANAVFDLFTPEQVTNLLSWLQEHQLPMLATLHYTGMRWADPLPDEAWVIGLYEAHMQRPKAGSRGLGAMAPFWIGGEASRLGAELEARSADWEIPASSHQMQAFLLGFMADSVPEMTHNADELDRFQTWLTLRQEQPSFLRVTHQDLWITW